METRRDIKQPSENLMKKRLDIKRALSNTAIFRQARVDSETLQLYAERLLNFSLWDVQSALKRIEDLPRGEGETAFPEIGIVLAVVREEINNRLNRLENAKSKRLVSWKCPDCKRTQSGWIPPGASLERRCPGIPADGRTDTNTQGQRVCGAKLEVIYDEAPDGHAAQAKAQ